MILLKLNNLPETLLAISMKVSWARLIPHNKIILKVSLSKMKNKLSKVKRNHKSNLPKESNNLTNRKEQQYPSSKLENKQRFLKKGP